MTKIQTDMDQLLRSMIKDHDLPDSFPDTAAHCYQPVAEWVHQELLQKSDTTSVFGINGGQGTGKTTLADFVRRYLTAFHNHAVVSISMDDFYLTRDERAHLARNIHALLLTRGPPGTHDIRLALATVNKLKTLAPGESTRIPCFDKATDDRAPRDCWPTVTGPVDLVILEGWCVGCEPADAASLLRPINELEANEDSDGTWRKYVNDSLATYQPLFAHINVLLMLQAPNFDCIYRWRCEQEEKLAVSAPNQQNRVMSESELLRFVQLFERITRASAAEIAAKARLIIELADDHQVRSLSIK